MLVHVVATVLAVMGPRAPIATDSTPKVTVAVDSAHHEVVVTVGHIHLPEGPMYGHQHTEINLPFVWPVDGWLRGYRVDVVDSSGHVLPRAFLHHAGVANLDRRALPYPVTERLVAAGSESPTFMLPVSMGVPLTLNTHMVLYYALVNPTPVAVDGAVLRITMVWTPASRKHTTSVFPLFLDASPAVGGSRVFDIPPGRSTTSAEFTLAVGGHVRALGGHLHDYAVELRLEDAVSNKVLSRLTTKRDASGHVLSISADYFLFKWHGLHLDANHRYRVVAVYDNPTCATIVAGAMAFFGGPFAPDDMSRWPAIDPTNPLYREDYDAFFTPPHSSPNDETDMADMVGMHHEGGAPACTSAPKPPRK